jgi:hypothetical protein
MAARNFLTGTSRRLNPPKTVHPKQGKHKRS